MNTLPTPDLRNDGSRCDHMIRIGRPLIVSKFIVSRARSAEKVVVMLLNNSKIDLYTNATVL